ncbi:MAG: TonB family protein [Myxococcota bacterium]
MFESVIRGGGARSGERLGKGAVTAIVVHVAVIVAVVVLASGEGHGGMDKKKDNTEVTFVENNPPPPVEPPKAAPPPPPAAAPPPPLAAPQVTTVVKDPTPKKPKPKAKPATVVTSEKPTPAPEPGPVTNNTGTPGVAGGTGDNPDGKVGDTGTGKGPGSDAPPVTNQALPFGEGMNRPTRISGRDPQYTREALEAHVEGTMIIRCVIETDGTIQSCKVIKSLPYMEKAVLDTLTSNRYTPVTFQGQPVRVNYTFNIKLVLPQ